MGRAALAITPILFVILVGCQTAGVARAYMALDGSGNRRRTTFFTDTQAIWCDVQYSSGRADVTIDVQIRSTLLFSQALQRRVPVDEVIANGEIAGQQGTELVAGFQWVQLGPGGMPVPAGSVPYPVGDYVCEVSLDGQTAASLPFTIEFPACPVPPVASGAPCAGWVANGSTCPDAFGNPCVCQDSVWAC
jgi:hypothetical protein